MVSPEMKALIDAPLADPWKINLPAGKRPAPRAAKINTDDIGGPKLTAKELRERKAKAANDKLDELFAYYATTDLSDEAVAKNMGLYRQDQVGVTDEGKPMFERVLDVARVTAEMRWRRAA